MTCFGTNWLVRLALLCHLAVTFGLPMPSPGRGLKGDGVPYPCQSRPCGCVSSEQCWKGDCCCFTIEEKLAWAEENGVEPPEHVRPMVESRRSTTTPPKKSCCEQGTTCCNQETACESEPDADCPNCAANRQLGCCSKTTATNNDSSVRWVVGIFAQKCRGEGPAGLLTLEPTIVTDFASVPVPIPERVNHVAPRSEQITSLTHSPPTRPPRLS